MKGPACPFRLGNQELPPIWGYGRPIPNTSIPHTCPAALPYISYTKVEEITGLTYIVTDPPQGPHEWWTKGSGLHGVKATTANAKW